MCVSGNECDSWSLGLTLQVYGPYVFIPIITTCAWLSGILALLAIWVRDGKPQYAAKEADVVFISNVAGKHKVSHLPMIKLTFAECLYTHDMHYRWVSAGDGAVTCSDRSIAGSSSRFLQSAGCDTKTGFRQTFASARRFSVRAGLLNTADVADWGAIFFAAAGGAGLIALSIVRRRSDQPFH